MVCGKILLVPDVLSAVLIVVLCYIILCLFTGGGGGGPSLWWVGITVLFLGFRWIASLCGVVPLISQGCGVPDK